MLIARVLTVGVMGVGLGLGVSTWKASAQETPATTAPATRPMRGPAAPAGLGAAMREMEKLFKSLREDGADPEKYDQNLHNIALLERDAAIAKLSLPPSVRKLSGDEKVKQTEAYRVALVGLMKGLMAVEDAIVAKNPDEIKKSLDGVEEIMNKGHEAFIPKEN